MSIPSKDHYPRHNSPFIRSSKTSSTAHGSVKQSPSNYRDSLFDARQSVISSLQEQSINLQQELDFKETQQMQMRKQSHLKIRSIEDDIIALENKKTQLLDKIEQVSRDAQEFDHERAGLARAISVKDDRIADVVKQLEKLSSEQDVNKKVDTSELAYHYEVHENYLQMLSERQKLLEEFQVQIRRLETECDRGEQEIARLQADIERKLAKILTLKNDKQEAEEMIETQDYKIKSLKFNESDLDSDIKILLGQKAKLLSEREALKGKMEEVKENTHHSLLQLLAVQNKLESKMHANMKVFSSRMMAIVMRRYQVRKMGECLQRIEAYTVGKSSFQGAIAKLSGVVNCVQKRYAQETLLKFHNEFLSYSKLSQLNEEMLRIKVDRKIRLKAWITWRQRAKVLYLKREHQNNALTKMSKAILKYEKKVKSEFFSMLREKRLEQETKLIELHNLFTKRNIRQRQRALLKWMAFTQVSRQTAAKTFYENNLTNTRFLAYFFNKLKENMKKMKARKFELLKKNFEQWQNEYKFRRRLAEDEVKVDEVVQLKDQKLVFKVFLEWKNILLGTTNERVWENFNKMTEEYNTSIATLKAHEDTTQKRIKRNCFVRINSSLKQRMNYYFRSWNLNAKKRTRKMILAIKCLNRVWDKSLRQNFKTWKVLSTQLTYEDSRQEGEKAVHHINKLEERLTKERNWHKGHSISKTEQNVFLLERIAQRYRRRLVFLYFRKFHNNLTQKTDREKVVTKGFLALHKIFLRSFRQFFAGAATEHIKDKKLMKIYKEFTEKKNQSFKMNSFTSLKNHCQQMQNVKSILGNYLKTKCKRHLSKRFFFWAYQAHNMKHKDSKHTNQELEGICLMRTIDLEKIVKTSQESELSAAVFEKKAVSAKYAKVWSFLIHNIQSLKLTGLRRWREHAKNRFYKRKASFLMEKWFTKLYARHFLSKLIMFGDQTELLKGNESLEKVISEKSELQGRFDNEKEKCDTLHQEQETKINERTTSRNDLKKSNKFLFKEMAKRFENEKNKKLLLHIIPAWKKVIEHEKTGIDILVTIASKNLLIEIFDKIKQRSEHVRKIQLQKRIINKMIENTQTVQKEIAFTFWKRFSYLKRKESTEIKLVKASQSLSQVQAYFARVKESGTNMAILRNRKNMLRRYFTKLSEGVNIVRTLRKGNKKLATKFADETKQSFFQHMFLVLKSKKNAANIVENARIKRNFNIKRNLFTFWKEDLKKNSSFVRALTHYQAVLESRNTLFALDRLSKYSLMKTSISKQNKKFATTTCVSFADMLLKVALKRSLSTFVQNVYEIAIIRQRTKELFIRAHRLRVAPYLSKWRRKATSLKIVSNSPVKGNLHENKKELEREVVLLEDFAINEGYDREELELVQTKADLERFSLLQKSVSRLMVNASGLTILTKALNSWKEFVSQRKRVKLFGNKLHNYLRKTDLMMGFNIWRTTLRAVKRREEVISKKELRAKLAEQKNQDFFLNNSIKEIDTERVELEFTVEKQQIELDVAKMLAAKNLGLIPNMFTRKIFNTIKRYSQEQKNAWKLHLSDNAGDKILKLQREIKCVESDYKGLFQENQTLRAISLQGLSITDAIKEMSKERDRLANELEAKNITAQKLVNENKGLAIRLATAQREAEELIKYTKEFIKPASLRNSRRGSETNESLNGNNMRTSGILKKK